MSRTARIALVTPVLLAAAVLRLGGSASAAPTAASVVGYQGAAQVSPSVASVGVARTYTDTFTAGKPGFTGALQFSMPTSFPALQTKSASAAGYVSVRGAGCVVGKPAVTGNKRAVSVKVNCRSAGTVAELLGTRSKPLATPRSPGLTVFTIKTMPSRGAGTTLTTRLRLDRPLVRSTTTVTSGFLVVLPPNIIAGDPVSLTIYTVDKLGHLTTGYGAGFEVKEVGRFATNGSFVVGLQGSIQSGRATRSNERFLVGEHTAVASGKSSNPPMTTFHFTVSPKPSANAPTTPPPSYVPPVRPAPGQGSAAPHVVVNAPSNVEATSASGAQVTYTASATDNSGGTLRVSCSPPSGSTLPLGRSTITCTATDRAGNTGAAQALVVVRDTTAPRFTYLPGQVNATSSDGNQVPVNYPQPQASDSVGAPNVSCVPVSGSGFAVGTTIVNCYASDPSGNRASASFPVTVSAPSGARVLARPDAYTLDQQGGAGGFNNGLLDNDNAPSGATVTVTQPPHGRVDLHADGTFVYTTTDGNVGQSSFSYTVTSGSDTSTAQVTLYPYPTAAAPTGQYFGHITNASTGGVLPGASITATSSNGSYAAGSNTDGSYDLKGLSPGTYTFTYHKDGYADYSFSIYVAAGDLSEVDEALTPTG